MLSPVRFNARITMPPAPFGFEGKDTIVRSLETAFGHESEGAWRLVPAVANRMHTAASYLRAHGDTGFRAFKLDVIRDVDAKVAEVTRSPRPCSPPSPPNAVGPRKAAP